MKVAVATNGWRTVAGHAGNAPTDLVSRSPAAGGVV